ncbi:helicase HerA domain-containing protein [Succinimonas sp.]|uniref:helicase HerA domain-containing protein n=1 Tax=Succinimonas sp. TaxID=1936151 RepID=UPI003866B32D
MENNKDPCCQQDPLAAKIAGEIDNLGKNRISVLSNLSFQEVSREQILRNTVFFRITCLTYEKKFPRQEAFENVVTALKNSCCRVIYYLRGGSGDVEFYIGITSAFSQDKARYNVNDYEDMLSRAIRGNFIGSTVEKADNSVLERLADDRLKFKTVLGVPSRNNENRDDLSFQGVERLVNVMNSGDLPLNIRDQEFHLLVIWESLDLAAIQEFGAQVESLYSKLSAFAHSSIQSSSQDSSQKGSSAQTGTSEGKTTGETKGKSESQTSGKSATETTGASESKSSSKGSSSGTSENTSSSTNKSQTSGTNNSETSGATESETTGNSKSKSNSVGKSESQSSTDGENNSRSSSSHTEQAGTSEGSQTTTGTSNSISKGTSSTTSSGSSKSETTGSSSTKSQGTSSTVSETKGTTSGTSQSKSSGHNESSTSGTSVSSSISSSSTSSSSTGTSESVSTGSGLSITFENKNKKVQDILKYIDEELMVRIKRGISKGLFRTAVYVGAGNPLNCDLLCNTLISLAQGDKNFNTSVYSAEFKNMSKPVSELQICQVNAPRDISAESFLLESRPVINGVIDAGTWLTAQEISMLAGFPQKEVPGLELREQVPFGLNINTKVPDSDKLDLGVMRQEGCQLKSQKVNLSRKELSKHVFIAGTTGSGKTTTCHRLLASSMTDGASLPFLVIEPAKTEYRALVNSSTPGFNEIIVFTVGNGNGVPFRFNPLEFLENETLSGHIDELKAAFMASFDMEAAIPNLLEQGLYRVYKCMGWDIETGENRFLKDRHAAWQAEIRGVFFPTLEMYIETVVELVKEKGFDDRLRDEYIGSIRARLDSLTEGAKGVIFNTQLSVDFDDLLDRRVIIELEDVKSSEDKSFLMALILSRLSAALKARHARDANFRHITLVEEAHRLLAKVSAGDSQNRKMGVELFSDLLAEVRKYGESLIIVDQIPSKLASEVLKNTNTKIIHKLFSQDDKNAVGETMALDDNQKKYLSYLVPGEAIVFSQGWKKPVDVQVTQIDTSTDDDNVDDEIVCQNGRNYWLEHSLRFCAFMDEAADRHQDWECFVAQARGATRLYQNCVCNENANNRQWQLWLNSLQEACNDDKTLFLRLIRNAVFDYAFRKLSIDPGTVVNFNYQSFCSSFDSEFDETWNYYSEKQNWESFVNSLIGNILGDL